jgi:hypothetical protein
MEVYQGACVCLGYGVKAQKAITEIIGEAEMVGETGGSIKKRLEAGGQIAALMEGLEGINRDCLNLPPDLFRLTRELRDYVEKTPVPNEDDVKRDARDIEKFFKRVIEDACR